MKKLLVRLLLVLAGFAGITIPANAQDLAMAQIPFQFIVAGQTFPAGEYKITRLSDVRPRLLLLSSIENGAAVVMLPIEAQSTPHDKAKLAFAAVGDQHFLSRIETASYTYTLSVPSSEVLLAATPRKGATASSSSGSNWPVTHQPSLGGVQVTAAPAATTCTPRAACAVRRSDLDKSVRSGPGRATKDL